jgi:hypothetical protein
MADVSLRKIADALIDCSLVLNVPLHSCGGPYTVFTNPVDLDVKPASRTRDLCQLIRYSFLDERNIAEPLIDPWMYWEVGFCLVNAPTRFGQHSTRATDFIELQP